MKLYYFAEFGVVLTGISHYGLLTGRVVMVYFFFGDPMDI